MGSSQSCPVYGGDAHQADNFFRAEHVPPPIDCSACVAPRPTWNHYLLVFHLLLSFVLVGYVRWSRVVVHNHACQQYDVPECCRRHHQQHQRQSTQVHAVSTEETHSDVKQSDVSIPTTTAAASTAEKPAVSAEEQKKTERLQALRIEYAAYLQMIKVRLPRIVVDHKLRSEGKDPAILDELLSTSVSTPMKKFTPPPIAIPVTETPADAEHRQKIESFQRMLKVGVPRPVVEMKARNEGVDPAELDSNASTTATVANDSGAEPVNGGVAAWSRRSSVCSTVSTAPSTPDALAARTATAPGGSSFAALALRKMNTTMRKKLHWTTTPYTGAASSALRRDSLWSRIHTKAQHERVNISTESRRWMEKLFVKVTSKTKVGRRRARSSSANSNSSTRQTSTLLPASLTASLSEDRDSGTRSSTSYDEEGEMEPEPEGEEEVEVAEPPGAAFLRRKVYQMLLDHKKSQNIAIVLARVKRSFPELTREILTLNCPVLSSPALQALIDMWPDSAEQEAIDQFSGDVSSLATAEQFLLVARKVPRVQQKLRCLQFKVDFGARVEELRENLTLMTRGVKQVCASEGFGSVLEYIFHLGNLLNFGEDVEYTECVKSISISSLAKLSFTKAYDGRISFLQYVVQSIERDQPHLAHFGEQLDLVAKCSKMSIQSLHAERQALEAGHRMLVNETQKAAVFQTDDEELREQLAESRDAMRTYADEVDQELSGIRKLADELDRSKLAFLNYFEEEDTLPLDELLGYIASFTGDYAREREQLILRARREQQQQQKKNLHRRSASVSNVTKRYSL